MMEGSSEEKPTSGRCDPQVPIKSEATGHQTNDRVESDVNDGEESDEEDNEDCDDDDEDGEQGLENDSSFKPSPQHGFPFPSDYGSYYYPSYPPAGVMPPVTAPTQQANYIDRSMLPDPLPDSRRNRGGVAEAFPTRLHYMLEAVEREGLGDVASFFSHGRAFAIHKPRRFVTEVMPRFFRQTKLTSFQRQLNLYGFRRLSQGSDNGGYYHEYFLKGRPGLCINMKRLKVKGAEKIAKRDPDSEPNFYKMAPVGSPNSAQSNSLPFQPPGYPAISPPIPPGYPYQVPVYPSYVYYPTYPHSSPPFSVPATPPIGSPPSSAMTHATQQSPATYPPYGYPSFYHYTPYDHVPLIYQVQTPQNVPQASPVRPVRPGEDEDDEGVDGERADDETDEADDNTTSVYPEKEGNEKRT